MTRDEAVQIAQKAKEKWGGGSSEFWLVIALEALGVIKLDEPKTTADRAKAVLYDCLKKTPHDMLVPSELINALDHHGFKIVEK